MHKKKEGAQGSKSSKMQNPMAVFFLTSVINQARVLWICQPFWVAFGPTVCKLLKKKTISVTLPSGICPSTVDVVHSLATKHTQGVLRSLRYYNLRAQNQAIKPSTAKEREVHKQILSSCLSSWKEDCHSVRPILELFQRQHWKNICEHFLHW